MCLTSSVKTRKILHNIQENKKSRVCPLTGRGEGWHVILLLEWNIPLTITFWVCTKHLIPRDTSTLSQYPIMQILTIFHTFACQFAFHTNNRTVIKLSITHKIDQQPKMITEPKTQCFDILLLLFCILMRYWKIRFANCGSKEKKAVCFWTYREINVLKILLYSD